MSPTIAGRPASHWREILQRRLLELQGRHGALSNHLRGKDGRLEADFGDMPSFTGMDEVLEGLDDSAIREITLIRQALQRLDQPETSFGVCQRCGDDVPAGRLEVVPWAPFCTECAR